MLSAAIRTADLGKPRTGVAAVDIALHDLLDDRPEIAVLPLETVFIFEQVLLAAVEEGWENYLGFGG